MKITDQIFFQIQKTNPFPQFLGEKSFPIKSDCHRKLKGFWHHAEMQKKLMIKFQENAQTSRVTDIPYFIGFFQLLQGMQQVQLQQTVT